MLGAVCRRSPRKRLSCLFAALTLLTPVISQLLPAAPAVAAPALEPSRVKWRVKVPLDWFLHTPGVGRDGTVYVPNLFGRTQAVSPV